MGVLLVLDDRIDHNVFCFHNDLLLPSGMSSVNICGWLPVVLFSSCFFLVFVDPGGFLTAEPFGQAARQFKAGFGKKTYYASKNKREQG